MKKLTVWSLFFVLMFYSVAFAAAATSTETVNYTDLIVKSAMAALMTALAAILTVIVPIIAKKGDSLTDSLWTALRNYAKKIENERIEKRINAFLDILNKGTDRVWDVVGKAVIEKDKVTGKVVVKNLDELTEEIKTNVAPEVTNSTKELAKDLGVDAEAYIRERIKAKAQVML